MKIPRQNLGNQFIPEASILKKAKLKLIKARTSRYLNYSNAVEFFNHYFPLPKLS